MLVGSTLLESSLVKGPEWRMAARAEGDGPSAPGEACPQPRARMVQKLGFPGPPSFSCLQGGAQQAEISAEGCPRFSALRKGPAFSKPVPWRMTSSVGVSQVPMGSPTRLCVSIAKSYLVLGSWLANSGFQLVLLEFPRADLGLSVLCHLAWPFLPQVCLR